MAQVKYYKLLLVYILFCWFNPVLSQQKVISENLSDNELLDRVQKDALVYFWEYAEPVSLMARDQVCPDGIYPDHDGNVVVTGGTGFGLMTMLVGAERKFIDRKEVVDRINHILDFLEKVERNHGAWCHRINAETGRSVILDGAAPSEDLVETSFLIQGLICVREYFKEGPEEEKKLAERCDKIWREVDWNYFTKNEDVLYWWFPRENEFNFPLEGYNECLITYVLAASSPTFPIDPDCFLKGWTRDGTFTTDKKVFGIPLLLKHNLAEETSGPLFWAHYSYLGLDPEGLSDSFVNYWDLNSNHAKINYLYCLENPNRYKGYSEKYWGLTAGYSRGGNGELTYEAHQPNHDLGIICPTAALSSFPYTPKESMKMLRFLYEERPEFIGPAGPYDATSIHYNDWFVPRYIAIDQGTIAPMIENYRTGLIWNLFMNAQEIRIGLTKLGFASKKHDLKSK